MKYETDSEHTTVIPSAIMIDRHPSSPSTTASTTSSNSRSEHSRSERINNLSRSFSSLDQYLDTERRQRRATLVQDEQRVEDTLSSLRSLRKELRRTRRSVEDDRDEARLVVEEVRDIQKQVKKHLQAHYPFSRLEDDILNNSSP